MTEKTQETELKLELDKADLQRLKKAAAPAGFSVARAVTRPLASIYFDTPDLALKRAKWSLRVRRIGNDWIQTVKAGTGVVAGLSRPREYEVEVAAPVPDLTRIADETVREGLWKLIDGAPLDQVFETRMTRTTRVFSAGENTEIELALDAGEIHAGASAHPLFEAEFELMAGPVEALFDLASALPGLDRARLSPMSKAGRGYALLDGGLPQPAPLKADDVALTTGDTAESAFRAILRSCLTQIAANRDAVLAGEAPEAPHQLRIGLRRLRSALKIHARLLDPPTREALDNAARALATTVGALRDLDVLATDILAPALAEAPDEVPARALAETIAARRIEVRGEVRAALEGVQVNALVFALARLAEGEGWRARAVAALGPEIDDAWRMPAREFAARAMHKRWKAAARLGARIDDLDLEERHDMRKALKKLRYTLEFYRPLFQRKTMKPFLSKLKRLQDVFGYLNDVAMARGLVRLVGETAGGDADRALAAGFVLGWHEARAARAWQDARALWDDTRAADRFWKS
ncbi:CHAD domain-containing protein [Stappia sp.]|uniref:CYTH and CHAD domain-containing protein n=1 Tax=Stappia sp. TaxID=1870903 RepID=UPI003A995CC9